MSDKSDQPSESRRAPRGRPQHIIPPIPDTFENVIKALVRPVEKGVSPDRNEASEDSPPSS